MSRRSFDAQLSLGRQGERIVEGWLRQERGCGVIPSYMFSNDDGDDKAPRLAFACTEYVVPDLDCCKNGDRWWVEVKTYWHAVMNRVLDARVHGIKRRLYEHYQTVQTESGNPVWLAVLEVEDVFGDTAALCLQRLDRLTPHPCICAGCRADDVWCRASGKGAIKRGVYFRRDEFTVVTIADNRLAELHAAFLGEKKPQLSVSPGAFQ